MIMDKTASCLVFTFLSLICAIILITQFGVSLVWVYMRCSARRREKKKIAFQQSTINLNQPSNTASHLYLLHLTDNKYNVN